MRNDNIYVLEITDLPPEIPNVFYVGRTSRPKEREKEHRALSKTGHEDKYAFIREIEAAGGSWRLRVIKEIPEGEYPPDYERWYVIDYTRNGHDLMNMKHGDAEKRKEIADQVSNITIRNVEDVRKERERINYEKSEALKKKILEEDTQSQRIIELKRYAEEQKQLRKLQKKAERKNQAEAQERYEAEKKRMEDERFINNYSSIMENRMVQLESCMEKLEKYSSGNLSEVMLKMAQNNPRIWGVDNVIRDNTKRIEVLRKEIKELFYRAANIKPEMFNESDYLEIDTL